MTKSDERPTATSRPDGPAPSVVLQAEIDAIVRREPQGTLSPDEQAIDQRGIVFLGMDDALLGRRRRP